MPIPSRMNLIAQSRAARASERAAAEERAWREQMQWRELGMNALQSALGLGFGAAGKAIGNAMDAPEKAAKAEKDRIDLGYKVADAGYSLAQKDVNKPKADAAAAEAYHDQVTFGQNDMDRRGHRGLAEPADYIMGLPVEASRLPMAAPRSTSAASAERRPAATQAPPAPGPRPPEGEQFVNVPQGRRDRSMQALVAAMSDKAAEPPALPSVSRPVAPPGIAPRIDTGFTGSGPAQPMGEATRRMAQAVAESDPANADYKTIHDRAFDDIAARRRAQEYSALRYQGALTEKALTPPPTDPLKRAKYVREAITGTNKEVRSTSPYNWQTARAAQQVIENNGGQFVERMSFRDAFGNGRITAEGLSDVQREILAAGGDFVVTVPMREDGIRAYERALAESARRRGRTGTGKGGTGSGSSTYKGVDWLELGYEATQIGQIQQKEAKDGTITTAKAPLAMTPEFLQRVVKDPTNFALAAGGDARRARALAQKVLERIAAKDVDGAHAARDALIPLLERKTAVYAKEIGGMGYETSPGTSDPAQEEADRKAADAEKRRSEAQQEALDVARGGYNTELGKLGALRHRKAGIDAQIIQSLTPTTKVPGSRAEDVSKYLSAAPSAAQAKRFPLWAKAWATKQRLMGVVEQQMLEAAPAIIAAGRKAGVPDADIESALRNYGVDMRKLAPAPASPTAPQPERRGPDQSSADTPPPEVQAAHTRINAMPISASQKRRIWFSWLAQNGYGDANV